MSAGWRCGPRRRCIYGGPETRAHLPGGGAIAASVLWPGPAEVNPAGAGKAGADAPSAGAVGCGVDDLELELAAGVGEAADRAEDVAQSLRLQRPARARA